MDRKHLDAKSCMRYNRQISLIDFDIDGQEQLLNSSAVIFGVGGLGCAVSQYLVGSGIGKVTLIDDDLVDHSNLPRQILFSESDIGCFKVEAAKKRLQTLNAECDIQTIASRPDKPHLHQIISEHTVVLDCTDNMSSRNTINALCWSLKIPLVTGSAIRYEGQIFCCDSRQQSACYHCLSSMFKEQDLSCSEAGVLSPVVGTIGSIQASEAIKLIVGIGQASINKLLLYDAKTLTWQTFNIQKSSSCHVCR